jgi:hypothetical protein
MNRRQLRILRAGLALLWLSAGVAHAQTSDTNERLLKLEQRLEELERALAAARAELGESDRLARLERQLEVLTQEIETLKVGEAAAPVAGEGVYGLGPAASKVYQVRRGVSIGGYGELLYENPSSERDDGSPSGRKDQVDFLRGILYVGYKFSDKWVFNSELEFEHASTGKSGEASVEFATVDYLWDPRFNLRAGLVLVPMGWINELHEPPIFLGARRPQIEQVILPSTWRENGFGVFGSAGLASYRAYLVNGFDGAGINGNSGFSSGGLRGARQSGSRALGEDLAFVGRLDLNPRPGLVVGGSLYSGGSGQGAVTADGQQIGAHTTIGELHFDLQQRGWQVRGLWTRATVDDVEQLNALRGFTGNRSIGSQLGGWYLQAGYDILSQALATEQSLVPFFRWEQFDTEQEVPAGFSRNPANQGRGLTFGVNYRPILNVVIKADYQAFSNEADTGVDQFNLALGYLF